MPSRTMLNMPQLRVTIIQEAGHPGDILLRVYDRMPEQYADGGEDAAWVLHNCNMLLDRIIDRPRSRRIRRRDNKI